MNTLAFYLYPSPHGIKYYADDLSNPENVEKIFDYMQILTAVISKEGWEFLINQYGYEQLFYINQKSEWLDCESIKEFIDWIEYEKEIAPDRLS